MRTPTLIIKTIAVTLPLLLFSGDKIRHRPAPALVIKELDITEPLQLQLLKIRHQAQQGQIILLQNAIESKLK